SIHLLTLINQLLAFSEMKLNKIELYPSDLQLSSFLDEIVDRMSLSARSKQLQIIRKWEDLPDRVKIDEKRLRQILINLLSNAIKFTNTGEINIKVKALEIMKTNESLYQQKLRFEVRDTGIGMSERDKKKIFQPFEQLRDIQSRIAGTGLGLSIAERLIKLMGGNLKVESELGVGSTFWFE
uniref:sensor histidine kinase n=1 Tax=Anaplasma marginale TaxID=770 RepID=UPI0005B35B21